MLSEDAVQSVLNLVDPFPDDGLQAVGWPSFVGEHTLPLILIDYLDISPPANVTTTWNFKVLFMPFSNQFYSATTTTWDRNTGTTTNPVSNAANYGQFNIWTWRAEDLEPNIIDVPPQQIITLDPESGWSHVRITHAGFEAINTSADLCRGGMFYGFRTPLMQDHDLTVYNTGGGTNNAYSRLFLMSGFPDNLNDIINLSTTVTGSARDGVGTFSLPMESANPFTISLPTNMIMIDDISTRQMVKARIPSVAVSSPYNWMICGAYVTGLASQASFQLKARVGYELLPGADAPKTFQSMARKPVARSFLISEMLDQLLAVTPAAFDYKDNPLG